MSDAISGSNTNWKASYFAALKERDAARDEIQCLQEGLAVKARQLYLVSTEIEQLQRSAIRWISVKDEPPQIGFTYLIHVKPVGNWNARERVTLRFFAAPYDGCSLDKCYWLIPGVDGQIGMILQDVVAHYAEVPQGFVPTKDRSFLK